ncbi:MAG: hypothetical protein ACKVE4_08935 [Dissulfuribacterales bacterium]|uniref:hypothetical protein n=1 Tax=Desulfosarcina sp. BuS5 TaxID=933262 RepID=UPI000481B2E3|nr:hypothetical protein [Desulfosarcina sp. BuS5]WDN88942.1 hypothetical protein BuS5_01910 [Desulfosarcina sp. BuS5]
MCIKLDLSKHCIETETKRLHNQMIYQYFKATDDRTKLEKKIEALEVALKELDFAQLRGTYTELSGNSTDDVTLSYEKQRLAIYINGINIL